MPLAPLALNADDFSDLFKDPKYMVGAMAADWKALPSQTRRKSRYLKA